jgi:hypothetical protein
MHARRVEIAEPRRILLRLSIYEIEGRGKELLIDSLHSLFRERSCVLDGLLADFAELLVNCGVIDFGGFTLEHAARAKPLPEFRVLRIVVVVGLLFGIQVIEIAEKFVETVHRRQVLVAVAEMVLAELACRVAKVLHEFADSRVFGFDAKHGARRADLGEPGADRRLAGNECGATGGAALLAIEIGEHRAFLRNAIEIGCTVAHNAVVIATEIKPANVIGHDEQNVRPALSLTEGFLLFLLCHRFSFLSFSSSYFNFLLWRCCLSESEFP